MSGHAEQDPIGLTAENSANADILMSRLGFRSVKPVLPEGKGKTTDTLGRKVNASGDQPISQMDPEEDTFSPVKAAAVLNLMIPLHALITMRQHGSRVRYEERDLVQQRRRTLLSRTPGNAVWVQPVQAQAVQDQDSNVDPTETQLVWTGPGLVEPLWVKPAPPGPVEPLRVKLDLVVVGPDHQLPCPPGPIQPQVMFQLPTQAYHGQSVDQIGNRECDAPGPTLQ